MEQEIVKALDEGGCRRSAKGCSRQYHKPHYYFLSRHVLIVVHYFSSSPKPTYIPHFYIMCKELFKISSCVLLLSQMIF